MTDKAPLEPADLRDIAAIADLMNRAYRGAGPGASWTSEAEFMGGDRVTEADIRADMAASLRTAFLVWRSGAGSDLRGFVRLEPLGCDVWLVGSVSVDPRAQNAGLGRRLLAGAEAWLRARGAKAARMTVIHIRDSLIAWYGRRGYLPTGEIEPFPYGDNRFGSPQRDDLTFVVLQKSL